MIKQLTPTLTAVVVANSILVGSASAQMLEEVIVTAQKRAENLQDVPISVNVVDGESIERLGLANMNDLSTYVPNFAVLDSPSGTRISMRGIGSGTNRGFEQSVGLFVDGIYGSRNKQFAVPFFDLERVEALRGPQSVLFGKNTIAGAVSVITAKPTDEFEGKVSAYWETEYDEWRGTAILSGPITETLKGRIAYRKAKRDDGYVSNTLSGHDEQAVDEDLARISLTWEPSEQLTINAKYEYTDQTLEGGLLQLVDFGSSEGLFKAFDPKAEDSINLQSSTGSPDRMSTVDTEADNVVLNILYDFDALRVVSTTGYSSFESDAQNEDSDFSPVPLIWFDTSDEFEQFSQELRVESLTDGWFDYTAGLYYQDNTFKSVPAFRAQGSVLGLPDTWNERVFDQTSDSWSVFAEGTFHLSDSLRLIVGARYTEESKDVDKQLTIYEWESRIPETNPVVLAINRAVLGSANHQVSDSRDEDELSPSITLQWDMTGDTMLYGKASQGFKAGGFDASDRIGDAPQYEDEQVTAYEIGSKSILFDGRAELNAALFYAEYDDLQVQAFNGLVFLTTNAAASTSQGLEIDGRWQITDSLMLTGSAAYLDADYDSYDTAACTYDQGQAHDASGDTGPCTQDLSGRPLINSPKWSFNVNVNHHVSFSNGWILDSNLGANYVDEQYIATDLNEGSLVGGYTTWDAGVALAGDDGFWEVGVVARNLTDEREPQYQTSVPIFSSASVATVLPPRTVALTATLRF